MTSFKIFMHHKTVKKEHARKHLYVIVYSKEYKTLKMGEASAYVSV